MNVSYTPVEGRSEIVPWCKNRDSLVETPKASPEGLQT